MSTTVPPDETHAPAAAAPSATPSASTTPGGTTASATAPFNPDEVVDELIEEKGGGFPGARAAAKKLLRDKGKLLEKIRNLRARVAEDGSEVLKGDDAAEYKRFKALGLTAAQIATIRQERDDALGQIKATTQAQTFESVGESLGLSAKGRKAFARLATKDSLEIESREIEIENADGTKGTKRVPFARVGGQGEYTRLDDLLEHEYGEFLPALYADDTAGDDAHASARAGDSGSSRGHALERKATPMPEQRGSARSLPAETLELGVAKRIAAQRYGPRTPAGT